MTDNRRNSFGVPDYITKGKGLFYQGPPLLPGSSQGNVWLEVPMLWNFPAPDSEITDIDVRDHVMDGVHGPGCTVVDTRYRIPGSFEEHLEWAAREVRSWPLWKAIE